MTTETLAPQPKLRFTDNNNNPLVSGKLFTYQAGSTTKLTTYTDSTGLTPNSNPIVLDYRGECNCWIPPNTAYKFTLSPSTDTDPPTNPIWTVDNLASSQLISLYGGVDTGIANAYVITFAANFSAYTDGIVIIWIPSHTNTSASTINVNSLGAVSILNGDGSALIANELVANQPIQMFYKAGFFYLLTPSITKGSFVATSSDFTVSVNTTVFWIKVGNIVFMTVAFFSGTSNNIFLSLGGIPAYLLPLSTSGVISIPCLTDGGANLFSGAGVQITTTTISFTKNCNPGGFTNTGTKGLPFTISFSYSV